MAVNRQQNVRIEIGFEMTEKRLSVDEVIEIAFDIFEEMAPDNLEMVDLQSFENDYDEKGGLMTIEPNESWVEHVGFLPKAEDYYEVQIGLSDDEKLTCIFAKLLLSRNPEEKFCHIIWKRTA